MPTFDDGVPRRIAVWHVDLHATSLLVGRTNAATGTRSPFPSAGTPFTSGNIVCSCPSSCCLTLRIDVRVRQQRHADTQQAQLRKTSRLVDLKSTTDRCEASKPGAMDRSSLRAITRSHPLLTPFYRFQSLEPTAASLRDATASLPRRTGRYGVVLWR